MLFRQELREPAKVAVHAIDFFQGGDPARRIADDIPVAPYDLVAIGGERQDDLPAVWVEPRATDRHIVGAAHTDSGFITLLAQDGVSGLQARALDGRWIDVPPLEGTVVVNFGQVLEQWSAGRIRATEHRVLGRGVERNSIPFFYEARADATIAPLPIDPPDRFVPFEYGDFLWKRMTSFVEFRGMENERGSFRESHLRA